MRSPAFQAALDALVEAAARVLEAWPEGKPSSEGYPPSLGSFDDVLSDLIDWRDAVPNPRACADSIGACPFGWFLSHHCRAFRRELPLNLAPGGESGSYPGCVNDDDSPMKFTTEDEWTQ